MNDEKMSRKSKLIRHLVAEFNSNERLTDKYSTNSYGKSDFDEKFLYPEHLETEQIHMDNFDMELLTWNTDIAPLENKSNFVILHIHGGGYVGAMRQHYRKMAGLYAEVSHGAPVLTVDYRVAPEHVFPSALDDVKVAYEYLLDKGYSEKQIVLAGDSAGGGLILSLCHVLKSEWRRQPAGIIAMSPWADVTASGESYTKNYEIDPVFGNSRSKLIFENPYVEGVSPRDPRVSPMFGDFTGFPPMLIQVGTDEMLLSDSETVAAKAKAVGVKVRFTKYQGMFHVFQLAGTIMDESKLAWAEVGRFMQEI